MVYISSDPVRLLKILILIITIFLFIYFSPPLCLIDHLCSLDFFSIHVNNFNVSSGLML